MTTEKRTEQDPEIKIDSDWASLLDAAPPTTALRIIEPKAASEHYGSSLVQLEQLLSAEECLRLNAAAEDVGYGRTNYPQDYRGNLRLITTDLGLAQRLWERVKPHVPAELESESPHDGARHRWVAIGLNECFRLAKYKPGHRFGAHADAWFERSDEEMSLFTLNIYTNDVPPGRGGATRFYKADAHIRHTNDVKVREALAREQVDLSVQPEAGLAVAFRQPPGHEFFHDGEELRGGVKYLLRSDVMYRRMEAVTTVSDEPGPEEPQGPIEWWSHENLGEPHSPTSPHPYPTRRRRRRFSESDPVPEEGLFISDANARPP
jgi:prolyl 4-hydroxylase